MDTKMATTRAQLAEAVQPQQQQMLTDGREKTREEKGEEEQQQQQHKEAGSGTTTSSSTTKTTPGGGKEHPLITTTNSDQHLLLQSGELGRSMAHSEAITDTMFDRVELESDPMLAQVGEWSFPIFCFAEKHEWTVLSRLAYTVFKEADLFQTFKISYTKFFHFFHALEAGYWDLPFHNRIHAADVLHGTFYLTWHPVHAFGGPQTVDTAGALPLAQRMLPLELMALYTAAAMHDYDHPGRTNDFLVATKDQKSIRYNGYSVLENHHAKEAWRLLTWNPQLLFIENLDSEQTEQFRNLVTSYILATDLKKHFIIIEQFKARVPDMDMNNEEDRLLISCMLIKFADINSSAKPYNLHKQWTERICEEFYEQGDEQKKRQMSVSPNMDRNEPAVAKMQDSFITHIVNPLAMALNEAGLFPKESELITNLQHNHQKWRQQIEADQHQQQQQQEKEGSASNCDGRNNFGTKGEDETAMIGSNSRGVKSPMFNSCCSSPSSASMMSIWTSEESFGVSAQRGRAATWSCATEVRLR